MSSSDDRTPRERGPLRYIALMEEILGCLLIVVIFALVALQAAQRYLPGPTWVGAGEVARLALPIVTFLLLGFVYAQGGHVTIRVIDGLLGPRATAVVAVVTHVLVALCGLLLLNEAWLLLTSSGGQSTPVLGIPLTWTYALPLVGIGMLVVRAVLAIVWPASAEPNTPVEGGSPS